MSESAAATSKRNAEVVRRYLRVFETQQVADLAELVAEDVLVHGAGRHVQGRHYPEQSVLTPGLSHCRVQVDDLFTADDRVTVAFTLTYTHDRTGRDLTMTGVKSYRFRDGRIVEFWGETDLHGLLRQAGLVPEQIPPFRGEPHRVQPAWPFGQASRSAHGCGPYTWVTAWTSQSRWWRVSVGRAASRSASSLGRDSLAL